MKKILFFSMVLFVFSFSASAQTAVNTYEPEALAKKDLHDLVNVLDLSETPDVFVALNQLFISKHKMIQAATTKEEKVKVYAMVDAKLKATFNADQIRRLEVAGIYEKMTH